MDHSRPLFSLFYYFHCRWQKMFKLKFYRWLDSNLGHLELEATALPTVPKPPSFFRGNQQFATSCHRRKVNLAQLTFSHTRAKTGQIFCVTAGTHRGHEIIRHQCDRIFTAELISLGIGMSVFGCVCWVRLYSLSLGLDLWIVQQSHELINTFRGDYCPR